MKPEISEFSYGYALTEELIHWHGTALTAAPVFPSLYQEGQSGGGYDVFLQRPGIPLFLQFKLADCMVRRTASEVTRGHFAVPFYRMHIRPARHSQQHEMLLALEAAGNNEVYYSAPAFHTLQELNDTYLTHNVKDRSLWLKPSDIGPLPDNKDHHESFQIPGTHRFYSEPRDSDARADFETFTTRIMSTYRQRSTTALTNESLLGLVDTMGQILMKRRDISLDMKETLKSALERRHPVNAIAIYAHMILECQFFIVTEKQSVR